MIDKRGQVYLIAAIIIGFILFIIITPSNIVRELTVDDRFEELSKNFEIESAKFMNYLIEKEKNVPSTFLNFTVLFTSYSKTKNPDFGLVYAFINPNDNNLYLGNYLKDDARFKFQNNMNFLNGCFNNIDTGFTVAGLNINIENINFQVISQCQSSIPVNPSLPYSLNITVIETQANQTAEISFLTEVAPGNPELIIIAKEKKDQTRKIYTKGKFI